MEKFNRSICSCYKNAFMYVFIFFFSSTLWEIIAQQLLKSEIKKNIPSQLYVQEDLVISD